MGSHRLSAFVVMPLFAFANAGVKIGGPILHIGVALGVVAGLAIGKPLGITAAAFLAVKPVSPNFPRTCAGVSCTGPLG